MMHRSAPPHETPRDYRSRFTRGQHARIGKIEKARNPHQALIRLFAYLLPFQKRIAVVFLVIIITILLELAGPYLMGRAIDDYISLRDASGLFLIAVLLTAVYVSDSLLNTISSWIMAGVSQNALKALRRDLFEHMQSLSIGFFDTHPSGELMSRLTNDIEAVNQAVSQNVVALFASLLSLAGILTTMFVLNPRLAMGTLIVVPLMLWFTQFVARYTRKGFRRLQKDLGGLNAVLEESISGQKIVKAFRRRELVSDAFRKHNEQVYRSAVYANSFALLLMPLTNVLANFFVIVLAGLGGWLALKNLVTVGTIVTFIGYGRNFIHPLRQLANMYNSIQGALAGAERVFEIIDTPGETAEGNDERPISEINGNVLFKDVDFSYTKDIPVIRHMNLEVKSGETIALVGPTGAGKTTIVNLLTRFYDISGGSIRIDGHDIRKIRKDDLRMKMGIVLQDTFLFSSTVMENIRYGRPSASDTECIEAARMAEADHFIRLLPQGYQTQLSERAGNLSQGQRQLLAISRAILADPAILILDEATSSIDTRTEARIQKALLNLMKGRTSFVIAHRLSTIRDADQVIVIYEGEIVERGTHQELLDRKDFYYRLYVSQFKGQKI